MNKNLTNYRIHISSQLPWTRKSIGTRGKEGSRPGRGVRETGLSEGWMTVMAVHAQCHKPREERETLSAS